MTRFLFIADTHWGAGESGYKVQPKYDEKLPAVLAALGSWIDENGPIDFHSRQPSPVWRKNTV
jgi:hypothetical protein